LLGLWWVRSDGKRTWRAFLENARTGEHKSFTSLEDLLSLFRQQTEASPDSGESLIWPGLTEEANPMKARRLLLLLGLVLGLTLAVLGGVGANLPPVRAANYAVTNTNASGPGSLRQAVLNANGNPGHDTVSFPGVVGTIVLTDALPVISDDVTITGPGAEQVAVSGANAYRVFTIESGKAVTITGLTVRDGHVPTVGGGIWSAGTLYLGSVRITGNTASGLLPLEMGGGVYVAQGSTTLSGTLVVSNSAAAGGGGVYVYDGSATLIGTQVISNSASDGGGVYVDQGSATLNVSGGEVGSNSADDDGGGVYVYEGSATLTGTQVVSNSADYGGGVYVDQGSATMIGTQVVSNSAAAGGGVYVNQGGATLNVSGGEVGDNSADDDGGGVYVYEGSATLTGTQVVSNSAVYGGGVYVDQGSATLAGTQVVSNSADLGGGVLVYGGSAALNVSGGEVSRNSADDDGGGVYVYEGSATLSGTQVVSNSADSSGGGVFVREGSAALNVRGGEIGSNSAGFGGGVYVWFGSATLSGTQVVTNSGNQYGGGVYIVYGSATLTGTQVVSNSADNYGGGVFVDATAALNVRGGEVSRNSADYGGGLYTESARTTLSGTQVVGNSAVYGGGLYIESARTTLSGTHVVSNSADYGGGVYVHWIQNKLNMRGGEVIRNTAVYSGGAAYLYRGSATLSGTKVVSNSAVYGGGLYVDQGSATLNVSGGEIGHNSADDDGGGVYVYEGSAALTGTHVVSNSAAAGGGVYVDQGSVTLSNARVLSNKAGNGGGLYQGDGNITATNGCFVNNSDTSVFRNSGPILVATENWWGSADGPSGVGPGSGDSVNIGVDYLGFLTTPPPGCPILAPDLVIVKAVIPAVAAPGQTITYTLAFHNAGLRSATGVVITDTIPVSVTHSSLNVDSSIPITATGNISYVWEVVDLAPGTGGIITITGVLSDSLAAGSLANSATIGSDEVDANPSDNVDTVWLTVSATVQNEIYLPVVLRSYGP
jgi:uncharacterized repeat protein (TIGR01451 family)